MEEKRLFDSGLEKVAKDSLMTELCCTFILFVAFSTIPLPRLSASLGRNWQDIRYGKEGMAWHGMEEYLHHG